MNLIAGLTDVPSRVGPFNGLVDHVVKFAAPTSFTARDLAKLRRDCEILLERIKSNPKKVQAFVKAASAGDLAAAGAIAKELKLTEEDFENEGGGCFILLACCILLAADVVIRLIKD